MPESYESLSVWQKAMTMVTKGYAATKSFSRDEAFGLTSQLRRAAASVPSNLAEGKGRLTDKEYRHFLGNARGSLLEMETQLRISMNLGYLDHPMFAELQTSSHEVGRMLNGLIASLEPERAAGLPADS